MPFYLPPLPFPLDALEPMISRTTLDFHYNKHHAGYVKKLNELAKGTEFEHKPLEEIILITKDHHKNIYDNAAQTWNHSFFWSCLQPDKEPISAALADILEQNFGSIPDFKERFIQAGIDHFGSGYVWLVQMPDGSLEIKSLSDALNPMIEDQKPLLCCDLWEHAYYLDYQNDRSKFLHQFWALIRWDFVETNYNHSIHQMKSGSGARAFDERRA